MKAERYAQMFNCDSARILMVGSTLFLILGWKRNTRDDSGQWLRNGVPIHFDYLRERVVASGRSERELQNSASTYKRLLRGPI